LHEIGPHPADHDERRPIEPAHLQELPDHQRFERRPDAAGHDHDGVGAKDEVVQAREERPVLIRLSHEGVRLLLEVELDPNADPTGPLDRPPSRPRWPPASVRARHR
jgi:hypothetical protein